MNEHTSTFPGSKEAQPSRPPLLGKTALVTGASRGIGASVTLQLGQLGMDVAINYRSKGPKAQAGADELIALGRKPLLVQGDITDAGDLATLFDRIQASWGRLDPLVLNASGAWSKVRILIMPCNSTSRHK